MLRWARNSFSNPWRSSGSDPSRIAVPEEIVALVRPVFEQLDGFADYFDAEVRRCFGVDEFRQLIRRPRTKGTKVTLRRRVDAEAGDAEPLEFTFSTRGKKPQVQLIRSLRHTSVRAGLTQIPLRWSIQRMAESPSGAADPDENMALRRTLLFNLFDEVFTDAVGEAYRYAYYLPADRTGVMHAHRVVVRSLIERATAAGLRPASSMPALSGVMADFLEQLISFDDGPRERRNRNQSLVRKLEEEVLAGSIHMEKSEVEYPRFFYRPRDWKEEALPLMNASSMVSELAPVVLYLRHVVDPGDLLIIEEPESHLHPAMQVAFIRSLAEAVRAGIRVIITTHSEWVLEEVANLVSLSRLPEERRKGIDNAQISLSESDVGAWLFDTRKRPKGSKVEEIRLDRESGTFPSGFSHVSEYLYNRVGRNRQSHRGKPGPMTELRSYFRESIPASCCVKRCNKAGCKVDMRQAPFPFILIDMDCDLLEIDRQSDHCDFLFVSQGDGDTPGWVAALELKGRPESSKIVEQLQAGAQFAEKILSRGADIRFRPIAFYGGRMHREELTRLRSAFHKVSTSESKNRSSRREWC